jgi:hypothetical protein
MACVFDFHTSLHAIWIGGESVGRADLSHAGEDPQGVGGAVGGLQILLAVRLCDQGKAGMECGGRWR